MQKSVDGFRRHKALYKLQAVAFTKASIVPAANVQQAFVRVYKNAAPVEVKCKACAVAVDAVVGSYIYEVALFNTQCRH